MSLEIYTPTLVARLFRERRRLKDARLRLARDKSTLASMYRQMLRDTLATPAGLLTCAGLGFTVGLWRTPPDKRSRTSNVRSLAALGLWLSRLRSWLDPGPAADA